MFEKRDVVFSTDDIVFLMKVLIIQQFLVTIWALLLYTLIILNLMMIILTMIILKLLFMLDLWFGVIDINNSRNVKNIQAKN